MEFLAYDTKTQLPAIPPDAGEAMTIAEMIERYPDACATIHGIDEIEAGLCWEIEKIPNTTYPLGEVLARAPKTARALIVAELVEDQSDSMTDYYGHTHRRTVAIGWRTTKREDFRQLRRAAATFEPTSHLAPGKDDCTARVVIDDCGPNGYVRDNGANYYSGQFSFWHHELDDRGTHFETEAAALEFVATKGEPHSISFGERLVTFKWQIHRESAEHRENYSMGGGNYLKSGGRHSSGWSVSSLPLEYLGTTATAPYEIGGEIARTWSAM